MPRASRPTPQPESDPQPEVRGRILDAAFATFMKRGYAASSTLEIATSARASKRELYALVGNKQELLIACITERARRFKVPAELPEPNDREMLAQVLGAFGTTLVREITEPRVIAVFRLAIADRDWCWPRWPVGARRACCGA